MTVALPAVRELGLHSLFLKAARAVARRLGASKHSYTLQERQIRDAIGQHHFPLGIGVHPHERAAREALANPSDPVGAIRETLRAYYSCVQPKTPAEWLDLPDAHPDLVNNPSYAATFPWHANSPSKWIEVRSKGIPGENKLAGDEISIEHGWNACGPVSERKLEVETTRVARLYHSIREAGFIRHDGKDGDIDAVILRTPNGERWWINFGHHRAPVLAAFGYETLPVRIRKVFDISKVESWPQVRSGLFTPEQAVLITERLIAGRLPSVTKPWTDLLESGDPLRLAS